MVDIDEQRLNFARENGYAQVTYCVRPARPTTLQEKKALAQETARSIANVKWQDGQLVGQVQRVFECTGVESCLQSSIYAAHPGGTVVIVGMGVPDHTLPISDLSAREINLIPTWRYANAYPRAIEIALASITAGIINGVQLPDVTKLITHRFSGYEFIQEAFDYAQKTKDPVGKLIIKVAVAPSTGVIP
ncbi:hypothetical protein N0V90_004383 [Kalmusia sp. IMI 367209]|nr:hypothetical protein N0V90_004383 [Kalmusia sp. IMI 367209]